MRSFEISSLAILASSLLVKEILAIPVYATDIVVLTEAVTVTKEVDGTYETGLPVVVGTHTGGGATVETSKAVVSASSAAPPTVVSVSTFATSHVAPPVVSSSSAVSSSKVVAPTKPTTSVVVIPSTSVAKATSQSSSKASSASVAAPSTTLSTAIKADAVATAATVATAAAGGGKRGLAYNTASFASQFSGSSQVSWAYNWGSSSSGLSVSGIEYVPLLWGMSSTFTGPWAAAASSAIASGSKHLMSFNEPDLSSQANLSPGDAATGYKANMMPFAGKALLGAPAVTNGGSPMGLTWLKSFMSSCTNCQIDFVCIHWYDSASNVDYFKSYVQDAYTAGGNKPLWITEFQGSGTVDEQNTFLKTVLPWLDSQTYVARYAWFMAGTGSGQLMSSSTSLSTLGSTFKSFT